MAMDFRRVCTFAEGLSAAALALAVATCAAAQTPPAGNSGIQPQLSANQTTAAPQAHLSLDRAIELALQHNHSLLAARATIDESRAEEITANLRPNPLLTWDAQFLPFFRPGDFSSQYIENNAQFDIGLSYLFERGRKRQHRLQGAPDHTAGACAGGFDY